jgi:hypothetical protein
LKISIFDRFPFISDLVATGGDCMATGSVAKPNEEQPKRLPYNFARNDEAVESAVLSGKSDYWGTITLEPLQAIVALTEEGNLNVDVAGKTPLSDWRRIDR